jgi:hypothetical protein
MNRQGNGSIRTLQHVHWKIILAPSPVSPCCFSACSLSKASFANVLSSAGLSPWESLLLDIAHVTFSASDVDVASTSLFPSFST